MDAEAGLNRLARVVEVVGMIWAGLWAAGSLFAFFMNNQADKWFVVIAAFVLAAFGYGVAYAAAWVIRGFAQKKA